MWGGRILSRIFYYSTTVGASLSISYLLVLDLGIHRTARTAGPLTTGQFPGHWEEKGQLKRVDCVSALRGLPGDAGSRRNHRNT